jgi:hypothetical protein
MSRRSYAGQQHQTAERDTKAAALPNVPERRRQLVVGSVVDPAELEADRVADSALRRLSGEGHVTSQSAPEVARSQGTGTASAEVGAEGGAISGDLTDRIESARGSGRPLTGAVRGRMEKAFGTDLGDVRVHTGGEADALSRSISARAFTTGKDVFFRDGEFAPGTAKGDHVLAHELAHTQQNSGAAHRAIHRLWDVNSPNLDISSAARIDTVGTGQLVFFLEDSGGDKIAIKTEGSNVGLNKIAEAMQERLGGTKSVKHRVLDAGSKNRVLAML